MTSDNSQKNDIVELLVFDVLLDRVVSRILTAVPFFGLPVIKQITLFAISKLLRVFYDEAKLYQTFLKIDAKVDKEVKEVVEATEVLKENEDDPDAQENFKEKFRKLIDMSDSI